MKSLNKILQKFTIEDWKIYSNPLFKQFIDLYFSTDKSCEYKLFHHYMFRYTETYERVRTRLLDWYTPETKYFKPDGTLNTRIKMVRDELYAYNNHFFIGYCYYRKQLCPLFLHLIYNNTDKCYECNGYCIQTFEQDFAYYYEDKKNLGLMKNLHIEIQDSTYNNLTNLLY
jgi:hypothetical protein